MKIYIKFTKSIDFRIVGAHTGNVTRKYFLANEEFQVEHIKERGFNHVSIWLADENIIIPDIFNDMSIFTIIKK